MGKSEKSLLEPPPGFENPLERLLGCHRRIEKHLELLRRLRAQVEARGVDPEASAAAQSVLAYFATAVASHHQDEELEVFPLLEARITDPGELARFHAFRRELEQEHRKLDAAWTRLRRPLEGIADGLMRTLPAEDTKALNAAYARHILVEEEALGEFFDRWLDDADRLAIGHAMAARRALSGP